jgi:hypothetical protein
MQCLLAVLTSILSAYLVIDLEIYERCHDASKHE